jgi:hypothetical protein
MQNLSRGACPTSGSCPKSVWSPPPSARPSASRAPGVTRVHHLAFTLAADGHVAPDAVVARVAARSLLGRGTRVEGATVDVQPSAAGAAGPSLALVGIDAELPAGAA